MRNTARTAIFAITFTTFFTGSQAFAHGDTELPLFVAEGGADSGDCLDATEPCGTIGYALSRAGKGSQIQVAEGTFDIENGEDVFHLISGVVEVSGGFRKDNEPGLSERGVSLLTGVPFQYRELLEERGFQIVADIKGIENAKAVEADKLLGIYQQLKSSIAATPCNGGFAAGLPCSDVDLLSHVGFLDVSTRPSGGNDIWGFVDLNTGREYAIAGFNLGTAVFDVTDAENPREVGFVDGQSASWRDIKVYQFFDAVDDRWKAYAYVTTDGSTDGLFVIDMTSLPHSIKRLNYSSDITRAHNVYATNTDFSTGLSLTGNAPTLIIAGATSNGNGRFRSYSLANPESPAFVTGGTGIGYMHDAASLQITDPRKDTQCVNGGTYCELLLDFNENSFEIWDVTNPATPFQLSSTPYGNVSYVHSGWWSEDKQFVFVHDELDERDRGLPTTLRVFNVSNLRSPTLDGTWSGPTNAIDHNGFVRGNRYYMSNYSRGLTVLDISDPTNPSAAGRLDTYPASDGTMFVGAWGAYPFFYSGNIAISDINSGFYMAADQTRNVAQGKLEFTAASYAADEGQQAQLIVQRTINTTGSISVSYEILNATTDDGDYATSSGVLNWANGENANKTIDLSVANDGAAENMERLIVRLINPTGGATLGNLNTASVYLSDPLAVSETSFATTSVGMTERGFGTIVAVIRRDGSAVGPASVDYSMTGGDATPGSDFTGSTSGTLSWAAGDGNAKTLEFIIADDGSVENDETFELTLSNPTGVSISGTPTFTATIFDGSGANIAPNAIAGISQSRPSTTQVTLNGNQSSDQNGDFLSYQWSQVGGLPIVGLNNADSAVATFIAPTVNSDALLQFQLTVTDPGGLSDSATTTVTIVRVPIDPGGGSGSLSVWCLLFLAGVAVRRKIRQKDGV